MSDKLLVFQTWKTNELPENLYNLAVKLRNNNPNIDYRFFIDSTIVGFIKTFYPEYYEFFINLKYKIQQIDFFRYLVVYHFGGIYLDLDMDIDKSFDDLDRSKCIFPVEIGGKDHPNMLIGNYAFYSPSKHPFMKHIIDCIMNTPIDMDTIERAQQNHTDPKEHVYVYYTTGPELVTRAYKTYENKNDIILLEPSGQFKSDCFGDYGRHQYCGTWKKIIPDSDIII